MIALSGRGDEEDVIGEAVKIAQASDAHLTAVHVNDPHAGEMSMMMESPGPRLEEKDIRDRFRKNGFGEQADTIDVIIINSENISQALAEETTEADLLVLGHRKMSTFKSNLMDSIDEGIVNHAHCPVHVVQKK